MGDTNGFELHRAFMRGHLSGLLERTVDFATKLQKIIDVSNDKGADFGISLLEIELELLSVDVETIKESLRINN